MDGLAATLVFVDSTEGWIVTDDETYKVAHQQFVAATGGTVSTCGTNFKMHILLQDRELFVYLALVILLVQIQFLIW